MQVSVRLTDGSYIENQSLPHLLKQQEETGDIERIDIRYGGNQDRIVPKLISHKWSINSEIKLCFLNPLYAKDKIAFLDVKKNNKCLLCDRKEMVIHPTYGETGMCIKCADKYHSLEDMDDIVQLESFMANKMKKYANNRWYWVRQDATVRRRPDLTANHCWDLYFEFRTYLNKVQADELETLAKNKGDSIDETKVTLSPELTETIKLLDMIKAVYTSDELLKRYTDCCVLDADQLYNKIAGRKVADSEKKHISDRVFVCPEEKHVPNMDFLSPEKKHVPAVVYHHPEPNVAHKIVTPKPRISPDATIKPGVSFADIVKFRN